MLLKQKCWIVGWWNLVILLSWVLIFMIIFLRHLEVSSSRKFVLEGQDNGERSLFIYIVYRNRCVENNEIVHFVYPWHWYVSFGSMRVEDFVEKQPNPAQPKRSFRNPTQDWGQEFVKFHKKFQKLHTISNSAKSSKVFQKL